MENWLVAIPAWGTEFVDVLCRVALPALARAAKGHTVRVIVHTDQPKTVLNAAPHEWPIRVEPWKVSGEGQWFERMSQAHRAVLREAGAGEAVMLLTADMLVSDNIFTACEKQFAAGKKLIACNVTRAVKGSFFRAPEGLSSRQLSEWGWDRRHDMTRDCTWPYGLATDLHRVYFAKDGNVVTRTWMPHPIALLADGRDLPFSPTIDANLIHNYRRDEIHVVTGPAELAVMELSPWDKRQPSRDMNEPGPVKAGPMWRRYRSREVYWTWLKKPLNQWLIGHRILVRGEMVDCGDAEAVRNALIPPRRTLRQTVGSVRMSLRLRLRYRLGILKEPPSGAEPREGSWCS